ncbi:hypothetical protein Bca52824_039203 [Brassica carinata]|uniref:Uncharacterized protein n=1 Tax=Brassica carinata TaxID=52824 RepID=A0A8X7RNW5_BRACI|nr:hypothetical protein Bca52824_039203 [Brassica carinata]
MRDAKVGKCSFSWDEDSLQLTDDFPPESEFLYVGSLNADDNEPNEQEEVSQKFLVDFNCATTRDDAKLGEEEKVTSCLWLSRIDECILSGF